MGFTPPREKRLLGDQVLLIPIVLVVLVAGALFGLGWQASSHAIHPAQEAYEWTAEDYPELVAEQVSVDSSTGVTLAGRFYKGETPATVVLLHGYGGNQDEVLPLADHLRAGGYSVFTYDQRGCGHSTGEVTFGAREQDDLISVVDYLATRPDVDAEKLGAFGFSMGGATTIMAVAREPRIKAVVADSAWSEARAWLQPSVKAVFTRPRDRFTALSLKIAEVRTGTDVDKLRPVDVVDRISPRPILLVHGTADDVIPVQEAERNHDAAKEPKQLELVPGAAHGDTITPDGAALRGEVRTFFDQALAPKAMVAA